MGKEESTKETDFLFDMHGFRMSGMQRAACADGEIVQVLGVKIINNALL